MSKAPIQIALLPPVEKWPTRKTPQNRFDTSVQAAMNQMSAMVGSLNGEFIPTVNALIGDINLVVAEREHIHIIGEHMDELLAVEDNLIPINELLGRIDLVQAVHEKMPHIEAAPVYADMAREYLEQTSKIASPGILASSAYNIRKPFVVTEPVAAGGVLRLPAHYFPGRDVLFLGFEGAICNPRKAGVEPAGEYQYTEVGEDPNTPSNEVVVHFDVPLGSVVDVWIVASAAGLNIQHTEELVAAAKAAADVSVSASQQAGIYAADAETDAVRAEEAAERAEHGATVVKSVVGAGQSPYVNSRLQPTDAPEGSTIQTPAYWPYAGAIHVYYEGLLLTNGINYVETAPVTEDGKAASITVLFAVDAGAVWEFHTWDAGAGDGGLDTASELYAKNSVGESAAVYTYDSDGNAVPIFADV